MLTYAHACLPTMPACLPTIVHTHATLYLSIDCFEPTCLPIIMLAYLFCFQKLITDAHTLTAFCFVIHTATAYVIFALIQFIKTWRISEFAIPLISDIDQADQVDKDMQVQYRSKNELFKNNQPMGEKAE